MAAVSVKRSIRKPQVISGGGGGGGPAHPLHPPLDPPLLKLQPYTDLLFLREKEKFTCKKEGVVRRK